LAATPLLTASIDPVTEAQRLATLESFNILDSSPEAIFDELVRMAASICETPIALVSLIDGRRQWFKSEIGLGQRETPRELAFCAHAIRGSEIFVVPDAAADARFKDNPLVTEGPQIRFYAGAPLIAADGAALGTLCVIDQVPREISPERLDALRLLGRHVMEHLELRKCVAALSQTSVRRGARIDELEASHRRQNTLIQNQERRINHMADYDSVTALPNRRLFLSRLSQQQELARLEHRALSVFVLDVQRFSLLSEALGHGQLEQLLKEVGRRLASAVGDRDDVAHLDADRFAFVLADSSNVSSARALLLERVLPALKEPFVIGGDELRVAIKVGVAALPAGEVLPEQLLRQAKTALARARESDEAFVTFTPQMEGQTARVISLETQLRRALERQEFELHYQPKVCLLSGAITGVEALLRWRDPDPPQASPDGSPQWIPPARFIPTLEATGLILEAGHWALEQAARDSVEWQAKGLPTPRIAVNISPLQLRSRIFPEQVESILGRPGMAPLLDVELTEAVLVENPEAVIQTLQMLRQLGVRVAIDDFGTGYSSLRYLARLPLDVLKIDMSFIHSMAKSPNNLAIVSSVISLAHGLRLKTVAEGVESDDQSNLLRLLRCDEIQGYLFSRPLEKSRLERLLQEHVSRPFTDQE
jgi:diguanylate cyclase (GGDEF)-like protein